MKVERVNPLSDYWRWHPDSAWMRRVHEWLFTALVLCLFLGIVGGIALALVVSNHDTKTRECQTFETETGYETELEDFRCYVRVDANHRVPLEKFEVSK